MKSFLSNISEFQELYQAQMNMVGMKCKEDTECQEREVNAILDNVDFSKFE
eukprot:CAMPEP_0116932660 /NCGR_PEP_ID=MMETSP0467-20121206/28574_1 /TAXON_ID=283647 /ORGANISM="Mesodinium pulex, Strain SPMC105" /LENGTH=50 /DNA_ID=CAMNT_0004613393 /DNA_START=173 /DNA_END=325 /DNA_ORIENTATION=+